MTKYLSLFFLVISLTSNAQKLTESRIEFETRDGYNGETIVPFGEDGFILHSSASVTSKEGREWKFDAYDTDLELEKTISIMMARSMFLDESFNSDEDIYMLFKNKRSEFELLIINRKTLDVKTIKGKVPTKIRLYDMNVLGHYAYFSASYKKAPYLFSIDLENGSVKNLKIVVEGYSAKKTSIKKLQLLEESDEAFVFVNVMTERKKNEVYVMKIDNEDNRTDLIHLSKDLDENIIDLSASKIGDDTYIYSGTYSNIGTGSSQGLIFIELEEDDLNYINTYSFLDLDEFLSYLPEKKQQKIEKKKKKKEKKGKELKFSYRIAGHDIILQEDGFTYIGEAYYPTYRTETYTTYVNGSAVTSTRQVFDGYQYTHAVIAKFSLDGELEWDRCFEMWPFYKPYYAKRFIEVLENEEDDVNLVFMNSNQIVSIAFDSSGDIIQENESDELATDDEGDDVKRSYGQVDFWYDNYFLAYGSQVIKNKEGKGKKRKRKVFYVSKIEF